MPTPFGTSPYLLGNQNNKYLTVNDALKRQEIVATHSVRGTSNAPLLSPNTGDSYLIGTTPSGLWTGLGNSIATWDGNEWVITSPNAMGWLFNRGTSQFMSYNGSNWSSFIVNNYNLGYQSGSMNTDYNWIGGEDIFKYSTEITTITTNTNVTITSISGMKPVKIGFTAIAPTRTYNTNLITGTAANNIEIFADGSQLNYFIGSSLGITELRVFVEYYV
jgi:hypothetical protein